MSLVFNRKRAREFLNHGNSSANNGSGKDGSSIDASEVTNPARGVGEGVDVAGSGVRSSSGPIVASDASLGICSSSSPSSSSSSFINPKHIVNTSSLSNVCPPSRLFRFKQQSRNLSNSTMIPENPFDNSAVILEEEYPFVDPAAAANNLIGNSDLPKPSSSNPFADPISISQDGSITESHIPREEFFAPAPPSSRSINSAYHISNNNYTSSNRRPISNNSSVVSQLPDPPARRYTISTNSFYNNNQIAPLVSAPLVLPRLSYTLEDYVPIQNSFLKFKNVPVPIIPARSTKKSYADNDGHFKVKENSYYANKRFKIKKILGQGTFSKVVQAYDYKNNELVAIKIIKAIPKYREAATVELRVLSTLKMFDPENNNGCIQIKEAFDFRNHISIVTELLPTSVYDFMEINDFKSFPGSHIQSFAKQLLRSIVFLHDLNIIHTDLKPENILLLNDAFVKKPYYFNNKHVEFSMILKETKINVIDFGSAIFNDESHPDLITTRHYRAPEVTFGIGWSYECDLWSVGCILLELFIGDVFFDAHDNEEHLLMMEKAIGETIDMNLIMDCGINSLNDLNYLRSLRKPYREYGNHYVHERQKRSLSFSSPSSFYSYTESINGYGAIPKIIFSANNIDQLVYLFLEKRGSDFTAVDRSHNGDRIIFKKRKLYENEANSNKNFQNDKDFEKSLDSKNKGTENKEIVFPLDVSSKIREKVENLKSIQETICEKIDIDIDYKVGCNFINGENNLLEEYFRYCLEFVDDESRKHILSTLSLQNDMYRDEDQNNKGECLEDQVIEQPGSSYYNAVVIDDDDDDDDDIYYDYGQSTSRDNIVRNSNSTFNQGIEYMKCSVSPTGSLSPWSSSSLGSFIAALGGSSTSPSSSSSGANGSSSSSAYSAPSMVYKNLNSTCGGILNIEYMKMVHFNNYSVEGQMHFILTLKEQMDMYAINNTDGNHNKDEKKHINAYCKILKDMVTQKKYNHKLRSCKKFQMHELHKFEYHLNGQKIKISNLNGPVDFDCFKFWFYFIDLLKKLLVFNPYKRLTAYEAFNHEWFKLGIYDDGTCNSIN